MKYMIVFSGIAIILVGSTFLQSSVIIYPKSKIKHYMLTEKPDIYILDHRNYKKVIEKNLLLNMDKLYSLYDSTQSNENEEKIATIQFDTSKSKDAIQPLSKTLNF